MTLLELQDILGERIKIAIDPDMTVEERKKQKSAKPSLPLQNR